MNFKLRRARDKVAAANAAIEQDDQALAAIQREIAALQAKVDELRKVQTAKGLRAQLAAAERDLAVAEEEAVKALAIELAAATMRLHAADPIGHQATVQANLVRLRAAVRSELDTPINEKYSMPAIVVQALALLPQIDPVDRPVYELGAPGTYETTWPARRRQILAQAEQHEPEAA
jgi:uncharacterized protein HemX